jgi:hypothetical protein
LSRPSIGAFPFTSYSVEMPRPQNNPPRFLRS